MALFTLWRELDHTMDEAERENMTIRSIGSLEWYPGVHWLHSWVIDEPGRLESLCVYEGPNQQKVEEASMRCSVPFVEVREAQIFLPGDYLADEWNQPLGDKPFFMITRQHAADLTEDELNAAAFRSAHCLGFEQNIFWVRSYWDDERKSSRCVYQATGEGVIRAHAELARIPCDRIDRVTEARPESYAWAYDALGVPRHRERGVNGASQCRYFS